MGYDYIENEFGISLIVDNINNQVSEMVETLRNEKVIGEVEQIILKDLSLSVVPKVESYDEIQVFTHRFAVTFYGKPKGVYFNVMTFHSQDIYSQEYQAFLPDDFEITYDENGVEIASKYILSEEKNELITLLNRLYFHDVFESEFKENVIDILNKIGYEIEDKLFE